MPCYHPLDCWRGPSGRVVFSADKALVKSAKLQVPCGQCIGCRLERSRQWAVRCMHEASLHDANCFITLTYDDVHLPSSGSLVKSHWQKFAKRLRKRLGRFRYYHCGEYGEQLLRPHYHACIFGLDFPDKVHFKDSNSGEKIYTSDLLSDIWSLGFCTVGDVSFESAAYVARYVMKKISGDMADDHYGGREPEYGTMSRRPGIGRGWYEKWSGDVYPSDEVIVRGYAARPPRYYDNLYSSEEPEGFERVKRARVKLAAKFIENQSPDRLLVREKVIESRVKLLRRGLDE